VFTLYTTFLNTEGTALQFELAKTAITDLKQVRANIRHREDQNLSIDSFEKDLIRNGLGGGDQDNDQPLYISYEAGEAFLERIE
jgi:hypothetical protein